ncbi:hypothetical protein VTN00DRAFT_1204 [Thermoascus crustaceus]|uniref:uncharacterized protein n=1 Tax=Thermoascus crustaceus TaxID=5088 RepID=UPI00374445EC
MPHTSRRKKTQARPKRLEVADEDGWTHVTTAAHVPRKAFRELDGELLPAEAPARLNIDELKKQYNAHKQRWENSSSWDALKRALQNPATRCVREIDNVVCIGLGSPSGFLRGGWVDRRSVSLYQLAALASILEYFEANVEVNIKEVSAQDPVFNDLDKELLQSLGITVVEHPKAFNVVNERTLLYCPGAETAHLAQILPSSPALLFGGPLDSTSEEAIAAFVKTRSSLQLPLFEPNEHAFWNMRLYWKEDGDSS